VKKEFLEISFYVVGGWFDAEDLFGALETYKTIERTNPGTRNTLVMGPWFHGGWRSDGDARSRVSVSVLK
jgi:uncharacterized protein